MAGVASNLGQPKVTMSSVIKFWLPFSDYLVKMENGHLPLNSSGRRSARWLNVWGGYAKLNFRMKPTARKRRLEKANWRDITQHPI